MNSVFNSLILYGVFIVFCRYLFVYHKVNKGDDPDLRPYDADDAESGRKRQKMPHIGVPMRYNYRQHVVSGRTPI